jgi:hypothetical protein
MKRSVVRYRVRAIFYTEVDLAVEGTSEGNSEILLIKYIITLK